MLATWPFWTVLAAVFFGLSVVSWVARKRVNAAAVQLFGLSESRAFSATVLWFLDGMLTVELVGFAAAGAAAILSVFA